MKIAVKFSENDCKFTPEFGESIQIGGDPGAYEEGYTAGQQAEYDRFWDYLQQNGKQTDYSFAFGSLWDDDNFKPKYSMCPVSANSMFKTSKITDLQALLEEHNVMLDFSKVTGNRLVQFLESSTITRLGTVDISTLTNATYVFFAANRLETIEKIIFAETNVFASTWFQSCGRLANLNIVEGVISNSIDFHWSPLTNQSVQNIIDHLKDLTGQTTQTLTLKADVGAAVTDAQKVAITAKNWTLVY